MNRIVSEGRLTAILVLLALTALGLQAQTRIRGVVNQYVQVTDVVPCDSLVRVGNPTNFVPGDPRPSDPDEGGSDLNRQRPILRRH